MTETADKDKGARLFEKLLALVRDAYEGVTEDDYQSVIDYLDADPSGRCAGMAQELKQLGAAVIRERILHEFQQVTDEERTRTPAKIQRVLEASPLIAAAFDSDVLWTLIDQRYNKRCLVEKFRQHPEMLYRLDASSSSSSSSSSEEETSAVDPAQPEESVVSPDSTEANMPSARKEAQESMDAVTAESAGANMVEDDGSDQEDNNDEPQECDSNDIVWDLFSFVAERFAEAFTTPAATTGPQDSCHFQGNW